MPLLMFVNIVLLLCLRCDLNRLSHIPMSYVKSSVYNCRSLDTGMALHNVYAVCACWS